MAMAFVLKVLYSNKHDYYYFFIKLRINKQSSICFVFIFHFSTRFMNIQFTYINLHLLFSIGLCGLLFQNKEIAQTLATNT